MATSVLSVRLDEKLKERGSAIIRGKGSNPTSVVSAVWEEIVATGKVPGVDTPASPAGEKPTPYARIMELRAQVPTGTPLSTMTADDLKKELADRG